MKQFDFDTVIFPTLAYIWGKSEKTIPIPGFKKVKQAVENARVMQTGPLSANQVQEIDQILNR